MLVANLFVYPFLTENVYRQCFTNREPNMKRPSRRAMSRRECNAIARPHVQIFPLRRNRGNTECDRP
ncbi:hypothetical protein FHL01_02110 [Cylindrospermopsis raciborskii CS-506_C]|nr:hypothetical protein [Cylindrospermopsis raciborskii CS-506_C]